MYQKMPLQEQLIVAKYWQTAAAFSNRLGNMAFCFTKKRFVGLVPDAAKVGDRICLLHGGRVPFVLRRQEKGFSLVGECYVHGLMKGEALKREGLLEIAFQLV
jgi:hypothetical protein